MVAALVGAAAIAPAADGWAAKGKVGVRFSGSQAEPVRDAVTHALEKHDFQVVGEEKLQATATKLHVGLDTASDLVAVAGKLKLVGIVAGEVKDGAHRAAAVVRSGSSGKVTAKARWSAHDAKKLAEAVAASAWAKLGSGLRSEGGGAGAGDDAAEKLVAAAAHEGAANDADDEAETPKPHKRAPAEEPPPEKPAAKRGGKSDADLEAEAGIDDESAHRSRRSERSRSSGSSSTKKGDADDDEETVVARPRRSESHGGRGQSALELAVGPRLLWRDMHYDGNTGQGLVPFTMAGAPVLGASGAWYPGAQASTGPGGNIGLAGNLEYASGITSKATDGATFPTASTDFFGGLRARLPLGTSSALALTGGYGRHAFVFHSGPMTDRANINVPDVDNQYLRVAADLHLALSDSLSINGGGGYRKVLSVGKAHYQLGSDQYFPHAAVAGYDLTVSIGYRFASVMEVQVGYDLRKYTYTTNAAPGDPIQIKAFADKYSAIWLNLGLVVDGLSPRSKKAKSDEDDS